MGKEKQKKYIKFFMRRVANRAHNSAPVSFSVPDRSETHIIRLGVGFLFIEDRM